MELGGKNSAIVLPDADLEKAAEACIAGAFLNSGQICMSTDRIIIHAAIKDDFLAVLKTLLPDLASSKHPVVVSSGSRSRLETIVSQTLARGAKSLRGTLSTGPSETFGAQFIPQIIGTSEASDFWHEENFGPLVGYVIVDTEDEAIEIANRTEYGLKASVFTRDLRKGLALAKRLECGAVHINSMTVHDEPALPFGGVKSSGWGRFNAEQGLDEFLVTKCVTWDD